MVVVTPSQPPATVYALLQKAKPSWSAKDLQRVYQKLQKVAITDGESLARSISEGSLNPTLAAAGERKLKSSTLAFLRLAVRDPVRTPKESVDEYTARQQAMQTQLPSLTSSPGPAMLMPSKRPSLPAAVVLPPLTRPSQPSHRSWRSPLAEGREHTAAESIMLDNIVWSPQGAPKEVPSQEKTINNVKPKFVPRRPDDEPLFPPSSSPGPGPAQKRAAESKENRGTAANVPSTENDQRAKTADSGMKSAAASTSNSNSYSTFIGMSGKKGQRESRSEVRSHPQLRDAGGPERTVFPVDHNGVPDLDRPGKPGARLRRRPMKGEEVFPERRRTDARLHRRNIIRAYG
ncbi:unnamed protein product [Symbiodinium sp. CCMP2592]|nr:unnamed protein product [Symbiodinium sp. CCMP2592]